jgi:hypothetical protein
MAWLGLCCLLKQHLMQNQRWHMEIFDFHPFHLTYAICPSRPPAAKTNREHCQDKMSTGISQVWLPHAPCYIPCHPCHQQRQHFKPTVELDALPQSFSILQPNLCTYCGLCTCTCMSAADSWCTSLTLGKQIKDIIEEHQTGMRVASSRSLDHWKSHFCAQVKTLTKWRSDNPERWQAVATSLAEDPV